MIPYVDTVCDETTLNSHVTHTHYNNVRYIEWVTRVNGAQCLMARQQAILWTVLVWHDMALQTIRNCKHHARILPKTWNADIINDDERERGRLAGFVDEIIDVL